MQPLRKADPSTLAGYRLLGRLGAGGMGVVFLARSAGGTLAALKLIRAEHAADPGFRERFRREARAAERITGRWVVRVLGADPEAREPWLATEYVPGPSLAEAVGLHGALPEPTVRALGARLASALVDMHEAGLVHRDVKPGNVLLALDGPRLIDFGIARSAGATALTATDAMIGTPGFLAPEQARVTGAGEVGPASDVFSLGCVLAYALTGERPFGTGAVAAVVYRTVHEQPDLDGVPDTVLPLVAACLAKDPADRPTAAQVRAALGDADGPAGDWLPPGLPALIAQRSTRVLDLPVAEPTLLTQEERTPGVSRRRVLMAGSAAAVAGAGGLTAWLLTRSPGGTGTGTGGTGGSLASYTVGVVTDLSGLTKSDGRGQERGIRLAVEDFNARADRPFDVRLRVEDDGGKPERAKAGAAALLKDPALVGVLGPTTVATAIAVGNELVRRRTALASVIADVSIDRIEGQDTRVTYFQPRPLHDLMTVPFGRYLTAHGAVRTAIVEDRAAGRYSWYAVKSLNEYPPSGDKGGVVTSHPVEADSEDFGPAVRAALATDPQGVIYAGMSPRRAALCARALREQGYRGPCGTVEYVLEPEFLAVAGPAAEGWYFGTGYVDPDVLPTARKFAAAYRKRWGLSGTTPVDRFATEAYDVTNWALQALRTAAVNHAESAASGVINGMLATPYTGITKTYLARSTKTTTTALAGLYLWQVKGGVPRCLGDFREAAAKGT
ncbi:Putative serine or threonine protein kinase [Streptomyces venezuelae]|uniref:bifunctional serine/threonine-protein kinase/ABC transporter substrate-binding protein n=1 Tax=Streptomyces gardneri TaxID=66892 RepID=UPI0006BD894A|nr:bifunctional serine/threonine-protein kinase/ABC transporter substrate-binding protein [Streptomyces gardneri]ALO10339.1 Putative serine or threonine protein kinase [Streptomyces venezuelae]QPK47351.1 ABC transporter substrate-binding protein [Streptomyces gardneri]WRK38779.1 bifunctional serine/threonine-protein kinase/ABC transporter substrate-binding protein [Streptomyces venezuelae]CUM39200.1 putative serine/threonine protein kinase [Streptomyces venezuelae]